MVPRDINRTRSRLLACGAVLGILLALTSLPAAYDSQPRRQGAIVAISASLCDDMKLHHVMNPGAPVGCERLKLVKFGYLGFDGRLRDDGEIVVMDAAAEYVLHIFTSLRNIQFPIAKAKLMNHYDGNDDASMADNNTSAFNVRQIAGGGSTSLHAYGLAIDVNPVQNPYAKRSGDTLVFSPPSGADYANRRNDRPRKNTRPGMAEAIIDVFADNGFLIWGGYWDNPLDYQHFQVSQKLAEQLANLSPPQAHEVFRRHVERYRTCRRAGSARAKCIVADDTNGNHVGD